MTPIQLFTDRTPNGRKVSIMIEEVGLPYEARRIDIENGDQLAPSFLALNPNGKIPVIVDPDRDRTVFESGAILHYLAERSGRLLPRSAQERSDTLAWTLFQAAHLGPTLGQLWHFKISSSERLPYALARFETEASRLFGVLDAVLTRRAHIAGEDFGIADVMSFPWVASSLDDLGLTLAATPHLARWHASVGDRPAVRRGMQVPEALIHVRGEAA